MQSHTCMALGSLSFRCDLVPLETIGSRSLSCLVHQRPLPCPRQPWMLQRWRFKRPQKTLQWEEYCSQVPWQVIWRRRPKNDENRRNWAQESISMRLEQMPCALGMENQCHETWALGMRLENSQRYPCALGNVCAPRAFENVRGAGVVLCVFVGKPEILAQT